MEIVSRELTSFMQNDERKAFLARKQEEQKEHLKEERDDCQDTTVNGD